MKNWGLHLDEKFLDPAIYPNKGYANRSRSFCEKKQAKDSKRRDKKKIEESSGSMLSEDKSSDEMESEEASPPKK